MAAIEWTQNSTSDLEAQVLAGLFPMLAEDELTVLAHDIKENGLRDRIVLHEGKILDGRNRHAACLLAGVEPQFEDYSGGDALGFVVSKNLHRRHLSESQRAMVAAKLADLARGANQHTSIDGTSRAEAAGLMKVSTSSIERGVAVMQDGTPELIAAVEDGNLSVSAASKVSKLPAEEQRALMKQGPAAARVAARGGGQRRED